MKKNAILSEDPVVHEVRQARQKLWNQAGGTMEGLLRLLDERVPKRRAPASKGRRAKAEGRRGRGRR